MESNHERSNTQEEQVEHGKSKPEMPVMERPTARSLQSTADSTSSVHRLRGDSAVSREQEEADRFVGEKVSRYSSREYVSLTC
ncbi:hypothetical protein CPLU01_14799 [Colletotrichum plurivorum]|uniref:Uncharacterized protein n=1 Tax=Colletotrichum plurivorum TaxID=2175906 RepID=A0A8H6MXN2_9PEZI|nr:hypothetical protein CPLU01_14799 [Colletotrichum plurivorum]